nr:hypothetical protein [Saprospiraceae bacterium]
KEYPEDLELQLNFAESLLWNKAFAAAQIYYQDLVAAHPNNFAALLGHANAYANLRQFEQAHQEVSRALIISPGNGEALKSLKYIRFGLADRLMKSAHFDSATVLLNKNLEVFPEDRETLLNMANVYINQHRYDSAAKAYQRMAKTGIDSVIALNGWALVHHLKQQNGLALKKSNEAMRRIQRLPGEEHVELIANTRFRHVEALIWNKRFKEAKRAVSSLKEMYPDRLRSLTTEAMLNMYMRDFKRSRSLYQTLLSKDSLSFDGNLGNVDALFAAGYSYASYRMAKKTRKMFAGNKDAQLQYQKVAQLFRPSISSSLFLSRDNAENIAYGLAAWSDIPLGPKFNLLISGNRRQTENQKTNDMAHTQSGRVGIRYKVLPRIEAQVLFGLLSASGTEENNSRSLIDIKLHGKAGRVSDFAIGMRQELQDFNQQLIDRNIMQNHFYGEYALSTLQGIGLFAQYYFTDQSDQNQRQLFFGSLYYILKEAPIIKVGVNYQYIAFKEQVPELYFSPNRFHAQEVFMELSKEASSVAPTKPFYLLSVAAGQQNIDRDLSQATYRIRGTFGIRISHRFSTHLSMLTTNVSSASAGGFRYTQLSLGMQWHFKAEPLFKVN